MKILITGAHFTPAVAVIEQLKKTSSAQIIYVGREKSQEGDSTPSVESQEIPKLGVKFISIITGRLQRAFTIYTIPSLLKIPIGFIQAFFIILTEKPDVILSFGGYVAVPIVIVGWFLSIPIIIHEQTLVSGLANTISSWFADKIAISFETRLKSEKTILTGNPLRKEVLTPVKKLPAEFTKIFKYAKNNKLAVILIMGGNQGSHIINKIIEESLEKLCKITCVIHVSGDNKYHDFERLRGLIGEKYLVKRWIGEEIGGVYSNIDLVISRAGINTLTELAYLGKPVLAIPIPYLYHDEQNKNAKFFEKLGLVKILPQSNLSTQSLVTNIAFMLKNIEPLKVEASRAKKIVFNIDSAQRLALETLLLAGKD